MVRRVCIGIRLGPNPTRCSDLFSPMTFVSAAVRRPKQETAWPLDRTCSIYDRFEATQLTLTLTRDRTPAIRN